MNVRMDYLYRDAGNNKLRGSAIFSNHHRLTLCQIADFVQAAFIKGKWFDPDSCGIDRLSFERHDYELDHQWHEIETISPTANRATLDIDIADFLFNAIKVHVKWVQFDCKEEEVEFDA